MSLIQFWNPRWKSLWLQKWSSYPQPLLLPCERAVSNQGEKYIFRFFSQSDKKWIFKVDEDNCRELHSSYGYSVDCSAQSSNGLTVHRSEYFFYISILLYFNQHPRYLKWAWHVCTTLYFYSGLFPFHRSCSSGAYHDCWLSGGGENLAHCCAIFLLSGWWNI